MLYYPSRKRRERINSLETALEKILPKRLGLNRGERKWQSKTDTRRQRVGGRTFTSEKEKNSRPGGWGKGNPLVEWALGILLKNLRFARGVSQGRNKTSQSYSALGKGGEEKKTVAWVMPVSRKFFPQSGEKLTRS